MTIHINGFPIHRKISILNLYLGNHGYKIQNNDKNILFFRDGEFFDSITKEEFQDFSDDNIQYMIQEKNLSDINSELMRVYGMRIVRGENQYFLQDTFTHKEILLQDINFLDIQDFKQNLDNKILSLKN